MRLQVFRRTGNTTTRRASWVPRVEPIETRVLLSVFPPDDRTLVTNTRAYPYSAIVALQSCFPDGVTEFGTGALIDSTHVLTAGHLVYSKLDGGLTMSILAIPALNGSEMPYGYEFATAVHDYSAYVKYRNPSFDLALVTLAQPIDAAAGTFGLRVEPTAFFKNRTLFTAGYPGDLSASADQLYAAAGRTTGATASLVSHEIDTEHGDSGSPLWEYRRGLPFIVAVHVGGIGYYYSHENTAVRITQSKFEDIRRWIKQDRGVASASLEPARGVESYTAVANPRTAHSPAVASILG
jgi:V8-like Glu-specific endopeptidase